MTRSKPLSLYHAVRWIGPLFLLDALGCVAVIAALAFARTRDLAATAVRPEVGP